MDEIEKLLAEARAQEGKAREAKEAGRYPAAGEAFAEAAWASGEQGATLWLEALDCYLAAGDTEQAVVCCEWVARLSENDRKMVRRMWEAHRRTIEAILASVVGQAPEEAAFSYGRAAYLAGYPGGFGWPLREQAELIRRAAEGLREVGAHDRAFELLDELGETDAATEALDDALVAQRRKAEEAEQRADYWEAALAYDYLATLAEKQDDQDLHRHALAKAAWMHERQEDPHAAGRALLELAELDPERAFEHCCRALTLFGSRPTAIYASRSDEVYDQIEDLNLHSEAFRAALDGALEAAPSEAARQQVTEQAREAAHRLAARYRDELPGMVVMGRRIVEEEYEKWRTLV